VTVGFRSVDKHVTVLGTGERIFPRTEAVEFLYLPLDKVLEIRLSNRKQPKLPDLIPVSGGFWSRVPPASIWLSSSKPED
jgi:hypothetical protein